MAYRILSLSGGGVRGIFQAVCLRELRKAIGSVREHFDLISGTSTGSIVALGVALDIDMDRVVDMFRIHGPIIFRRRALPLLRKGPRYPGRLLKEALREVFGDLKLKDCKPRVLVPATAIDRFQIRAFTDLGPHDPDAELSAVDVIMASCAAPTFFPPVQPVGEERHYVDGGIWGNSPALVAALAAVSYAQKSWADLRVVTIGNGTFPSGMRWRQFLELRAISPTMITSLFELFFSTQNHMVDLFLETLVGAVNIFRFDTELRQMIHLDDPQAAIEHLPAEAQRVIRNRIVEFRKFLELSA